MWNGILFARIINLPETPIRMIVSSLNICIFKDSLCILN